jgi:hypothetical protein
VYVEEVSESVKFKPGYLACVVSTATGTEGPRRPGYTIRKSTPSGEQAASSVGASVGAGSGVAVGWGSVVGEGSIAVGCCGALVAWGCVGAAGWVALGPQAPSVNVTSTSVVKINFREFMGILLIE